MLNFCLLRLLLRQCYLLDSDPLKEQIDKSLGEEIFQLTLFLNVV